MDIDVSLHFQETDLTQSSILCAFITIVITYY